MELKNILTFARVADLCSFTEAGRELGYTQSTVTVHIQQLEKELGVSLFDRVGKRISLTPKGEEFLLYANEMLSLTTKAKSRMADVETLRGSLRVGILESLFVWKFCKLVPDFHSALPAVNIVLSISSGPGLYQKLRQNEIDIAYLLNRKRFFNDCIHTGACKERVVFVTYPQNPIASRVKIPFEAVIKEPLILVEQQSVYRGALDELAAEKEIEYAPLLEVDNVNGIIELVKNGMGVSFLPEYIINASVTSGELVELDVDGCDTELWSHVAYHRNKWVTPQMELFIKLIEEDAQTSG